MPHPRSRDHQHSQSRTSTSHPDHRPRNHHPDSSFKPTEDSDSTIDLPDRFDNRGRLLPQKEQDPAGQKIEDFINQFSKVVF